VSQREDIIKAFDRLGALIAQLWDDHVELRRRERRLRDDMDATVAVVNPQRRHTDEGYKSERNDDDGGSKG
jgi:hypothetical protein